MAHHLIKISKQNGITYRVSEVPRITKNPQFLDMLARHSCRLGEIEDFNPEAKYIAFSLEIPPNSEKLVKEWLYDRAATLPVTPAIEPAA